MTNEILQTLSHNLNQNFSVIVSSNKSTVLIADDNEDTRDILRMYLGDIGYRIVEACDGADAVKKAQAEKPDIILMDLNMPKLNGIEASLCIRNSAELSNVPIIAISADGYNGIDLFANIAKLGEGYVGYIAKPFDLESLAGEINLVLTKTLLTL